MNTRHSLIQRFSGSLIAAALVVSLTSCATTEEPGALKDARTKYEQAKQDERVNKHASVALFEAEKAMNRAADAWENDEDEEVVDHLAYVAQQRVEIAQAEAQQRSAQQEVMALGEQREKILISLREAETQQARGEAESARQELQRLEQSLAALQADTKQTPRGTVVTLGDVLFPTDQSVLQPGAQRNLVPLAQFLKEYPERQVVIEGHTDAVGDANYNEQLSERRADAVKTFLITQGVDPNRVQARGLGENFPVASNDTSSGRQQNRRVDIVIANVEQGAQSTQSPAAAPSTAGQPARLPQPTPGQVPPTQ